MTGCFGRSFAPKFLTMESLNRQAESGHLAMSALPRTECRRRDHPMTTGQEVGQLSEVGG